MPEFEMIGHLAAIVESSDDAILSKTLDGLILSWNAAAERLYGYTAEEVVGKPVSMLVPPDRPNEVEEILAKLRRGETVDHFESFRVRKDGTLVPVSLTISPVRDASGRVVAASDHVIAASTIARDITERKRTEVALARLAAVVESSDDAILSKTLDGIILTWNAAAERLYGYTAEEIVGMSVSVLVPEDRSREVDDTLAMLRRGETVDHFESVRVRKDGSLVPVSLTISPVCDASGHIAAASTIARDISGRKQREALARAHEKLQDESRAKSEFLATMSHEIRTPLNGIIGLTGLLLDTDLTETQRHHAEGVRSSGDALLGIINDILDFSKIEAGKLELETVDFDLVRAIEDVASLVAEPARAKDLELVAYCRPEMPTSLRGDVGRLRQVLLNLAANAVKFTEAGEVVLRAGLAEEPTAAQVIVRFEVADTGVGVDPTTADRLFEPFSQGDASITRRYGGTGLGLAICRRLADAMGGTVGMDSRPGHGSTFWLRLPLAHGSGPIVGPDHSSRALAGRRVLVVDDNESSRVMLASQLRAWDIAADETPDAEDALEALTQAAAASRPYDIVLLDIAMPGMDGLALAATITSDPRLSSLRVLPMSSGAQEAAAAAAAGLVASLTKPIRLSSLYDALVRVVSPSPVATANPVAANLTIPAGSRGTLLIVEDQAINQEVASGMAAKLGYGSDVASDGLEALEALERRPYDAVLMDCYMPEMDGFQATAEIRRREAGPRHVPIIAMTAGAMVGDREKCIAAGMDDYVMKPVDDRDLAAVLDRWVGRGERAADREQHCPNPADGDGVLDDARFDRLRGLAAARGDSSFLRGLVNQYLDQAESQLAGLHDAAKRADAPAVKALAHGLKGSSAIIGASRMASACAALEETAARGEVAEAAELERLAEELQRAASALRATTEP